MINTQDADGIEKLDQLGLPPHLRKSNRTDYSKYRPKNNIYTFYAFHCSFQFIHSFIQLSIQFIHSFAFL